MTIAVTPPDISQDRDAALLDQLFRPMGVDGVYARTHRYETVIDGLQRLVTSLRPGEAEIFRFPPVMSRRMVEKSGYLNSFPQLLGCVCCLHGTERDILSAVDRAKDGADWTQETTSADLVLSPAACYPIYPIAAARGVAPPRGYVFDVAADCYRHEPSRELDRLQSFRMREFVRVGAPDDILAFRAEWMATAQKVAARLRLPFTVDQASDPFFGRVGQLKAANQMEGALKFELLIPLRAGKDPTACMSFNYHRDHFGATWGIVDAAGATQHTCCVAFGMDRLALALFANHGAETVLWPQDVRDALGLADA
jgi:seryl-tRNA synthetase